MGQKLHTTPLQREILWAAANNGRENVRPLLQNLALKFPAESPAAILDNAEHTIEVLARKGFLYLIWQLGSEERAVLTSEKELIQFKSLFLWNEIRRQWEAQHTEAGFTDLILQLTQGGV